jgi:hypothetical protein
MVDVFILSAKADRARVTPLAEALTARGFATTVGDGPAFAGAELAKAVIVAWTPASIKDPAVLAAAAGAGDRLTPVMLDPVIMPAAFAKSTPDVLSAWPGAAGSGPFERLILKLESMTAVSAQPASMVPQGILDAAHAASRKARAKRAFWPAVSRVTGLAAMAAVGGLIWVSMQEIPKPPPEVELLCGAAQSYCLTEEDMKTATEGGLITKALEKASREDIVAGATEGDVLSKGLLCLADALVERDGAAAAVSCKDAAQANSPLGNVGLARLFIEGLAPTPKDPAAALALLSAAADKGDVRALYLGAELAHNAGDFEGAKAALARCAPSGYLACDYLRAFMLENGQGETANVAEAVRIYTALAAPEKAFPKAQVSLAYLYETGAPPEVAVNLPEAISLYRRAAVFGEGFAHFRLGALAEAGKIEGEGKAEAIGHYRAALEAGIDDAAEPLAALAAQPADTGSVKK